MDGAFDYLKFLATLFVMVDPIGAVPIFLGLTPHYSAGGGDPKIILKENGFDLPPVYVPT